MSARPGREVLLEILKAEGVRYIFGNPGTTEGAIMHALETCGDLEYFLVTQEGVAMGMADGYARESGQPAFVNLHIETGLSNGLSLLFNASAGGTPMVLTSANSDVDKVAEGRTDLVELTRPFTKWGAEVTRADQLGRVMRRAFRTAKTPPTGPTYVSIAQNVLDELTDDEVIASGDLGTAVAADQSMIETAAHVLVGAKRPALLVGDRVAQYGAVKPAVALAELVGAAVYGVSYPAMVFPTSHDHWQGLLPPYVPFYREALADVDVLVAVGARVFHDFFKAATDVLPADAQLIQIDINQDEIARTEPVDVGIWADPGRALQGLCLAVAAVQTDAQKATVVHRSALLASSSADRRRQADHGAQVGGLDRPMSVASMMAALNEALPDEVILVDDSVSARMDLHAAVCFDERRRVHAERAGGAIGWGMGATLGVSLGAPGVPVVGVIGDGSAMMTIQALWTAMTYQLPVVYVICNNASYRILKVNLQRWFTDVLDDPSASSKYLGMDFDRPFDLAAIAQAFGVSAERVEDEDEVAPAIRRALALGGPALIDVVVDGSV